MPRALTADVVEAIVREDGHRRTVEALHREHADLGIHRARGLHAVGVAGTGIHAHLIAGVAEGIGTDTAGLHAPAAVVYLAGERALAPRDARGREILHGAADAVGDAGLHEGLVLRVGIRLKNGGHAAGLVRVCGGDAEVIGFDYAFARESGLRASNDFARNHAAIDHGKAKARVAIVEHEAAHMELVVNIFRLAIGEVAVDGETEPRGDVAGGRARAQDSGGGICQRSARRNCGHKHETNHDDDSVSCPRP